MREAYFVENLSHKTAKALTGDKYNPSKNYYMITDRDTLTVIEEDPNSKESVEIPIDIVDFKEDKEFEDLIVSKELDSITKSSRWKLTLVWIILISILIISGGVLIYGLQTL